MSTNIGGLLSLVILFITFLYASSRLLDLIKRHNPTINSYIEKEALMDDKFSTKGSNF